MTNKTIENAKAKVEMLEKLDNEFKAACEDITAKIKAVAIEKKAALASAKKAEKAIIKEQIKKLDRALKLFEGGNE